MLARKAFELKTPILKAIHVPVQMSWILVTSFCEIYGHDPSQKGDQDTWVLPLK